MENYRFASLPRRGNHEFSSQIAYRFGRRERERKKKDLTDENKAMREPKWACHLHPVIPFAGWAQTSL
ncbi:hypothetical protein OUZ56_007802 [Daphnia magna]|uniref:Uncharacterized protein n=1 Tax=Daphnia magna TaxID=35525 RepID=A0ABR0AB21_9CRUS|nr:hypothetical protein OUZ56_007802 [Daphnia magna]